MTEERKKQLANEYSRIKFISTINKGYKSSTDITMQCDKKDYEMMEAGLDVFLNTPVELGGAGGNNQAQISVRDKFNTPHLMTIEQAQQLALEMKRYYWQTWARKGQYYDNLIACENREQMEAIVF